MRNSVENGLITLLSMVKSDEYMGRKREKSDDVIKIRILKNEKICIYHNLNILRIEAGGKCDGKRGSRRIVNDFFLLDRVHSAYMNLHST